MLVVDKKQRIDNQRLLINQENRNESNKTDLLNKKSIFFASNFTCFITDMLQQFFVLGTSSKHWQSLLLALSNNLMEMNFFVYLNVLI